MNRSVMGRQMFANGGPAVAEMDPMMMQGAAPEMDPMMQGTVAAAQEQVDPNVLAAVFGQMEDQVTGIEGAEDIEGMINAVRGDEQPIEARRAELASLVGPDDAEATPDSVLALVQPVVQLAAVDQGIGALAAEDMGAVSMEGPMSEGIMSTVDTAMPAEQVMVEPPMEMGVGNQPPVNFNQGGVVRPVIGMQVGGNPFALTGSLEEAFLRRVPLYKSIVGDPSVDLEKQRKLAKSQTLFDIANTALAFAAPMEGEQSGMSAAERLAMAVQKTQLLPTIGARGAEQLKAEQAVKTQEQQMLLGALGKAEDELTALQKAAAAKDIETLRQAGELSNIKLKNRLDLASKQIVMELGFGQNVSLEKLRNEGELSLADFNASKQKEIQMVMAENREQLAVLQDSLDFKSNTVLQSQAAVLSNQQAELQSELRVNEKAFDLQNQLELAGVNQAFELERMEFGLEQNKALADHNAELSKLSQERAQAHDAAQAALDRIQRENLQLSDQNFRKFMQEELQKFEGSQADIDRDIAQAQRDIDNSFKDRGISIELGKLSIAEAAQALDEQYKLGTLAIDAAAAEAGKLWDSTKNATLRFISNPDRLEAYKNNMLDEKTKNELETLILDYASPKAGGVWDVDLGTMVKDQGQALSPTILKAIQEANPQLLSVLKGEEYAGTPTRTPEAAGTPTRTPEAAGTPTRTPEDATEAATETPSVTNVFDATVNNSDILNPDGTLNIESEIWETTPTTRFKPEINYREAVGASRVFPGLMKIAAEAGAELGMKPSKSALNLAEAQRTLDALSNDLMQYATNSQDRRVLKFIAELQERETNKLRPGGFFLKTDATALASIKALKDGLLNDFRIKAQSVPESGGNARGYSQAQVTKDRRDLVTIKSLLNELLAFEEAFGTSFTSRTAMDETEGADQSTRTVLEEIAERRILREEQ
jgi:hypothetical protein